MSVVFLWKNTWLCQVEYAEVVHGWAALVMVAKFRRGGIFPNFGVVSKVPVIFI